MHMFVTFYGNRTTSALKKNATEMCVASQECYVLQELSELPQLLLLWALPLLLPPSLSFCPSLPLLPSQQPVTCIILIRLQHKFLI